MSSTYIHIDSAFRNRNEWEFPSEFGICVNYASGHNDSTNSLSSGYIEFDGGCNVSFYNGVLPPSIPNVSKLELFKNTQNWINPVSNSAPIHTIMIQSLADPTQPLLPILPITFSGGTNIIPILNILNTISKDNVYNGYYIIKNPNSIVDCEIRVIQSYNSAVRTINMNQPFNTFNGPLDEYLLIDPSVAKYIITNSFPGVSFPFTNITTGITLQDYLNVLPYDNKNVCHLQFATIFYGQTVFLDNYYNNFYLYNLTNNQYGKIISYDGSLKLAFLDKYVEFNYSDVVILCKELPLYISQTSTIYINQNLITLDNVTLKNINTSNPAYAYIIPTLPTNYPPFLSNTAPPVYTPPVQIPPGYFFGPLGCDPILLDKSPKIKDCIFKVNGYTSINSCNKTVLDVCGPIPSKYFSITSPKYVIFFLSNSDSFSSSVFSLNKYPTSEMACYRLQLLSLILPNIELETGGRIAFYPYVLVEFQNDGTVHSKVQFEIASNNPNASSATFIAPIKDISNPIVTIFTKISSYGMAPTFKFSPEQNFKFKVYLPDGNLFKTALKDSKPPLPPNPLVQISAVFDVTRI